jgi:hypothetical protein
MQHDFAERVPCLALCLGLPRFEDREDLLKHALDALVDLGLIKLFLFGLAAKEKENLARLVVEGVELFRRGEEGTTGGEE